MIVNTGPGADRQFASTESVFRQESIPGFARQSRYITSGGFLHFESTDHPYSPRSGGDYSLRFSNNVDQTGGQGSFRQLDVDLRQYISFFQKQRVIVLRGYSILTDTRGGQTVPFYLQPTLGGPETLRGFRPFRFYDNNLILLTAEYRWKMSSGAELAFFGDGGKVFPRWREITLHDIEASYGAGIRFNVRQDVFLRCDAGISHEGVQVWLRFHNLF